MLAIQKEAIGLLLMRADVDEGYRTEFQKWHNCEHMTERVTIRGFYVGRRYRGIDNARDFLFYYETRDATVLKSEPYLHSKNNPTSWTKEAISHLENNDRSIYSLLATAGKKPPTDAPYVFLVRFNIKSASLQEVVEWHSEHYLPEICAVQGVYRGRLYEIDPEISDIITAERRIARSGPAQQAFLALYEISSLDLPTSKAWREVLNRTEYDKKILAKLEAIQQELYWLDFTMYAPGTE